MRRIGRREKSCRSTNLARMAMPLLVWLLILVQRAQTVSTLETLTEQSFATFIDEHSLNFVFFTSQWCETCDAARKVVEKVATICCEGNSDRVGFAQVDGADQIGLSQAFELDGFPTLKVLRDGEDAGEYAGHWNLGAFADFVELQRGPACNESREGAAKFSCENTCIQLYHEFGSTRIQYNGPMDDSTSLVLWLRASTAPGFGELNPQTFSTYSRAELPLLLVFKSEKDHTAYKIVEQAEREIIRYGVIPTHVDADLYGMYLTELRIKPGDVPVVIVDYDEGIHYAFGRGDLTHDSLMSFIEGFASGDARPSIKSALIMCPLGSGHAMEIVGSQFAARVLQSSTDVLLQMYASWDASSQTVTKMFDAVAWYLEGSGVVVMRMDVAFNDLSHVIRRHPEWRADNLPSTFLRRIDGTVELMDCELSLPAVLDWVASRCSPQLQLSLPPLDKEDIQNYGLGDVRVGANSGPLAG